VADAVEALSRAKAAVVPLVAGSGTRVKILEAWAAGTPVVSTSLGAEGLLSRSGEHLLVADQPEAFAEAVSSLLASAELRMRLGQAGRSLLDQQYSWEAGWRKLRKAGI
jgi:glycosyltransferase involved in cell wall biosynthesis